MHILAIETSMGRTSVALSTGQPGRPFAALRLDAGKPQAEALIPLIRDLMFGEGIQFSALDRIAVSIGPGGFSGIRTGVAAARGIGLAANVPVVGATSFRILAAAFEKKSDSPATYGLAAPAGLSAVFCQILSRGCKPLTEIVALPQSETGAFFEITAQALAGSAAAALSREGFVNLPVLETDLQPDAETLAELAPDLDPGRDFPSPFYVRPADARPQTGHVIARKAS